MEDKTLKKSEEYIRDKNCLFCKMLNGEIPFNKVFEDKVCLAFLDINPINPGHLLIIPKSHEDHIWDLDQEVYYHLFKVARKLKDTLIRLYSPERVGLLVEGFAVAHTHLHLIPLHDGSDIKRHGHPSNTISLEEDAIKIIDALT